jgi:hypothetical protein
MILQFLTDCVLQGVHTAPFYYVTMQSTLLHWQRLGRPDTGSHPGIPLATLHASLPPPPPPPRCFDFFFF